MGEALWDALPEGRKIERALVNFIHRVSQFGSDGHIINAMGNDGLGDEIPKILREEQLRHQLERANYLTRTVQVILSGEGMSYYNIKEDVAQDDIPFTDDLKRLAPDTRAVCFGSLTQRDGVSRATTSRFLGTMPNMDRQLKIFNISPRQSFYTREVLRESFLKCNVLRTNDEEPVTTSRMSGYLSIDLQDKRWVLLAKYNLKMLILTCSTNGSYALTPDAAFFQRTSEVLVTNTVGVDGLFAVAFYSSVLGGKSISEARKLTVEVSAYVCTQSGAIPILPDALRNRLDN